MKNNIESRKNRKKSILLIAGSFLLCSLIKNFEFLVLKTDQTFLAENIICKLFAIGVTAFFLRRLHLTWNRIGFSSGGFAKSVRLGLALGILTFSLSYLTEFLILRGMGLHPEFSFYIANFTVLEQNITGVSLSALLICLAGNAVNVWAEEGLFRGLFLSVGKTAFTPGMANLIQAGLFGVWHIITVIVWVSNGSISVPTALIMSVGYVALAGILGYEWGLCVTLTGTVWTGVSEHFFNNFIGNALHVVTENGADELQILRIVISNLLSLLIVVLLTRYKSVKSRPLPFL